MPARSPTRDSSRSRTTTRATHRTTARTTARPSSGPSPYRWTLPPEAAVREDPLRLRLDFHAESVALHDYAGGVVRTRLVAATDIAHALAQELDLASGLLPPDALWWARTSGGERVAMWRP